MHIKDKVKQPFSKKN